MNNGLTPENLLRSFPDVLLQDERMLALATAVAKVLSELIADTRKIEIYTRIDELPEDLLDLLAYDFKVDWWDSSLTVEEKRETLKSSWHVHRHLGTPYAVRTALSAIYSGTTVSEWFEYGGQPYHFRISIPVDQSSLDLSKHERIIALIDFYKNLRSVLDGIEYYGSGGAAKAYAAAACIGCSAVMSATARYF